MKLKSIYYIELFVAILAVIAMFMGSINNNMDTDNGIAPYSTGWTVASGQETVTLPYTLQNVTANQSVTLHNFLPKSLESGQALMFYTAHANVRVSIGGETIYSFGSTAKQIGKTPGCAWNIVSLVPEYSGKPIQITLTYNYADSHRTVQVCYLGTTYAMLQHLIKQKFMALFVSLCMALFSMVLVAVWGLQRKHLDTNDDLLYLGSFGVLSSLWSAVETQLPQLIWGYNSVFAQISWVLLLLIPFPFIMMVVTMFRCEQSRVVNVLKVLTLCALPLEIILFVLGIYDFRQMATLTHTLALACMVIQTLITARVVRRGDHDRLTKTALTAQLFAVVFSVVVAVVETVIFYYQPDRVDDGRFVRYGLMVYLLVLSGNALQNLNRQMQDSQMSKIYERMAYTDALTEVWNRAAFERDSISYRKPGAYCTIISIDLNNLKHINDTLGHSYGDMYITFCAQVLQRHFARSASLYRVGGDEFCLISSSTDLEDIQQRMHGVLEDERQIRERLGVENIGIAYGITGYESNSGETLEEALRRADKQMYENKTQRKQTGIETHGA